MSRDRRTRIDIGFAAVGLAFISGAAFYQPIAAAVQHPFWIGVFVGAIAFFIVGAAGGFWLGYETASRDLLDRRANGE